MDIIALGTQLVKDKFGIDVDAQVITNALEGLLGDQSGSINVQELISQFMANGGLQNMVTSWLGDGQNDGISIEQVTDFFGSEKIASFAAQLGVGEESAAEGLTDIVPQLIDKASSGGSLLDGLGDAGGMLDMAKKFF